MTGKLRILGLVILAAVYLAWVFDLFGTVAWLTARSDALWWQLLPWALLVVFWAVLLPVVVREWRRRT